MITKVTQTFEYLKSKSKEYWTGAWAKSLGTHVIHTDTLVNTKGIPGILEGEFITFPNGAPGVKINGQYFVMPDVFAWKDDGHRGFLETKDYTVAARNHKHAAYVHGIKIWHNSSYLAVAKHFKSEIWLVVHEGGLEPYPNNPYIPTNIVLYEDLNTLNLKSLKCQKPHANCSDSPPYGDCEVYFKRQDFHKVSLDHKLLEDPR